MEEALERKGAERNGGYMTYGGEEARKNRRLYEGWSVGLIISIFMVGWMTVPGLPFAVVPLIFAIIALILAVKYFTLYKAVSSSQATVRSQVGTHSPTHGTEPRSSTVSSPRRGKTDAAPSQEAEAACPRNWFCPNCGRENPADAIFCGGCGRGRRQLHG